MQADHFSMPVKAYHLPDFLALLPKKPSGEINPHFKEAEAAFNAWVEKKFSSARAEVICQLNVPLYVAMTIPLASYQQFRGFLGYCVSAFLLDDLLERIPSKDALAPVQSWLKILRDGNEVKNVEHPLIGSVHSEIMLEIGAALDPFHWPQFIAQNEEWVMNMTQEAHERELWLNKNTPLDIKSYMIQRPLSIGAGVEFVLIRCSRYLYIPDEVLANPLVKEMEKAATEMLIIENDVYSFKKEYESESAFSNLLTVMQKDPETAHLDLQERLDHVGELFKAAMERFYVCRQQLPSFNPEMDQYLSGYADALLDVCVGNVEWSCMTRRYNVFMNEEDRKNNVMKLAL